VSEGQPSWGFNAKWHRHIMNSEVRELGIPGIASKVVRMRGCESATGEYRRFTASGLRSWKTECWKS
jgi:hypothetical protein